MTVYLTSEIFSYNSKLEVIGRESFMHNKLKNITIPDKVNTIWPHAFMNNYLTNVTFANKIIPMKTIGKDAFLNNPLTSVTVSCQPANCQGAFDPTVNVTYLN